MILIPSRTAEDWRTLLADPDKQWQSGYSARSLAYCWQEAQGFPAEVAAMLSQSAMLRGIKPIFIIPEHQVPLPGGSRPSQNDVWVLAETGEGLVSMAVEGKVSEPFGPTVEQWYADSSPGKQRRLAALCQALEITFPPPGEIRYQLLHRTASAIIEAKRFRAAQAAMIVHSFSQSHDWLADFVEFVGLHGKKPKPGELVSIGLESGLALHLGWVTGPEKYLTV